MGLSWTARDYWLTRIVFERGLALVYFIAFLNAVNQFKPLPGEKGLLPVPRWIGLVPFRASPSLFYLAPRDWAFSAAAWAGVALSRLALSGVAETHSIALAAAVRASLRRSFWSAGYVSA